VTNTSLRLEVAPSAEEAARRVGALIAAKARARARFSVALSKTPTAMLAAFVGGGPPWSALDVFQVDERVAPAGTPDRNLTAILAALPPEAVESLVPMPVEAPDLEDAARLYDAQLPEPLDVVHLGLGPDGHTASLVPDDPVLEVRDRRVAATDEYEGFRRMTLTYPALDSAREILWLVTGEGKREALTRLLDGDEAIPAARIANERQLVVADADAAS
jgi:6-phosphogluconolactonase